MDIRDRARWSRDSVNVTLRQRAASSYDYAWRHRLPTPERPDLIVGRVGCTFILADMQQRLLAVGLYTEEMARHSKRPLMAFTVGGAAMIEKIGKKWFLFSRKGKVIGTHPTKKKAKTQERAITISKARAAGHQIPRR
jgi:hypothetical protein